MRTILLCAIAIVLGMLSACASSFEIETTAVVASVERGAITALHNKLTGEQFRINVLDSVAGLRKIGNRDLWITEDTTVCTDGKSVVQSQQCGDLGDQSYVSTRLEVDGADLLVTQSALSMTGGVMGVQWGLVVPNSWTLLVPHNSGVKWDAAAPEISVDLEYPMVWEAQFVLLQAKRGGFLIYAEDDAEHFKALHIKHANKRFTLGFETCATAPFEQVSNIESVRWRIRPYKGDWLTGAAIYRKWADKRFGLSRIRKTQPKWIDDIRFVVTTNIDDMDTIKALAARVDARKTLLYVPSWRRSGYDLNYPDYTPAPDFAQRMQQARDLGFRIMLHVNHFAVSVDSPVYEEMKAYHFRDPVTKQLMYWDWPYTNPPIKFAYINPASKKWREFFVGRMVELCNKLRPDALHLDQTLVVLNDDNGLIDGLNSMQGNIELHKAVRAALPDVALSGEGLNEITFRYEAFAQRQPFGVNYFDNTVDTASIRRVHPISSSIFVPHTMLYGALSMPNPTAGSFYLSWLDVYDRYGVIPTHSWPNVERPDNLSFSTAALLENAKWFQSNSPVPDFTPGWSADTIFAYRLPNNRYARIVAKPFGTALVTGKPGAEEVVSGRIRGVGSVDLPGSVPGWRAYDAKRLFGFHPAQSYIYTPTPRNHSVFHISYLPPSGVLECASVRQDYALLKLSDTADTIATLSALSSGVICGETLADGSSNCSRKMPFISSTGGKVEPLGPDIFMHPPFIAPKGFVRTEGEPPGLGRVWVDYEIQLPADREVQFVSGVGLRGRQPALTSDGVTFTVTARAKDERASPVLTITKHTKDYIPVPLSLDLAQLLGKRINLRLEAAPGPAGSTDCDWGLWTKPRVVVSKPRRKMVEVFSPCKVVEVISGRHNRKPVSMGDNKYRFEADFPGSVYLLFRNLAEVSLPADLTRIPADIALVALDGSERTPSEHSGIGVGEGVVKGVSKKGFEAHPPVLGSAQVNYVLKLPPGRARLKGFVGIRDGAQGQSNGVGFRILANGETLWTRNVEAGTEWTQFDISLAAYAGKSVVLTFVTEGLGSDNCDWAIWGEPRIIAE